MQLNPEEQYRSLMATVRRRLDLISMLQSAGTDAFARAESTAFQGRKVLEGIAFGCLVALENGLNEVPRDARGQWNADRIFASLKGKGLGIIPNPSVIRAATEAEFREHNVSHVVEGLPDRVMSHGDLKAVYARLHKWLHEINPYVWGDQAAFLDQHQNELYDDLTRVRGAIERHFIAIGGRGFFCTLWDSHDGTTKILALNK